MAWVAFGGGLMVGGMLGVFALGLCIMVNKIDVVQVSGSRKREVSEFLDENVKEGKGVVSVQGLYEDYVKWCNKTGHQKLNRGNFNKRVQRAYPAIRKDPYGEFRRMHWLGLRRKSGVV